MYCQLERDGFSVVSCSRDDDDNDDVDGNICLMRWWGSGKESTGGNWDDCIILLYTYYRYERIA